MRKPTASAKCGKKSLTGRGLETAGGGSGHDATGCNWATSPCGRLGDRQVTENMMKDEAEAEGNSECTNCIRVCIFINIQTNDLIVIFNFPRFLLYY